MRNLFGMFGLLIGSTVMIAACASPVFCPFVTFASNGERNTPDTFAQAVCEGLDPAGRPLDAAIPCWQVADQDIADLIKFLKTK
jgi:hypothetical protein